MMINYSAILKSVRRMHNIAYSIQEKQLFIDRFIDDNKRIARLYEDSIRKFFAGRGWYVAGSFYGKQYPWLEKAIKENREAEVEEFLQRHIRSQINEIRHDACAKWPHRASIINDAFDAHTKATYTLSVPVLLAQADGICYEIFEAFLFTYYSGKINEKINNLVHSDTSFTPLAGSFLGLLIEVSGLRMDTKKRDELEGSGVSISPLNRNGVLHGIDCDYGSESNSLRSIALLSFLSEADNIIRRRI
jgi:hypothetical protein